MQTITLPPSYIAQVQEVVDAGGTVTQKFQAMAQRWEEFANTDTNTQDELNAAILDPNVSPEELTRLHVMALAGVATSRVDQATVRNDAGAHVLAALRVEYRSVAAANYETIRQQFNAKAAQFVKTMAIADSEASPEEMVKASAKVRSAWSDGPVHALELTELLHVLHTAAVLAGKTEPIGDHDQCLIGLSVDATGLHRRRVWEGWNNTTGRAGRWRELWKLGATIEAPELDKAKAYREPRPMETRAEHNGLGIRQFPYDPEDDAHNSERDQLHRTAAAAGIHAIDYTDPKTQVNVN